jgi:predicted Zn-dependent peptidase
MLYKGTKKRNAKKIAKDIEKNGGELNGFTSEEITGYWCKIPSRNAEIALDVLTDMIKNPLFDKKEIEKERKVIFEEMKLYKDDPKLHAMDEIQKCLYSGTLSESILGTFKTINSINREKIVKKFKEVYLSSNMIFCAVGNYDYDKLANYLEQRFEKKGKNFPAQKIGLKNEKKIELRKGIDQTNLIFASHMPLAGDKNAYAALLLTTLMAGGMSSRLFSEIREKRNLAYAIKGELNINKDYSYLYIYVGAKEENLELIKKLILEEFKKVSKKLEEKELEQAKNQLIGNYEISMEDSQHQMINLLSSEINTKAEDFYDFIENVKKVELRDVKKLSSIKTHSFFALIPGD